MRKIMFSLLAIVAIAAVAGVGSYAGWSDTDNSEDNVITAGSMELEWAIDMDQDGIPDDGIWAQEIDDLNGMPFSVVGAFPSQVGEATILVRNVGVVDGTFTVEDVAYTDVDADGVSVGQLSQFVDITLQVSGVGRTDELAALNSLDWNFGGVTLVANGPAEAVNATWEFVDRAAVDGVTDINDTMGDSVFIDFAGVLTQI